MSPSFAIARGALIAAASVSGKADRLVATPHQGQVFSLILRRELRCGPCDWVINRFGETVLRRVYVCG
jgi:hypothetical protein